MYWLFGAAILSLTTAYAEVREVRADLASGYRQDQLNWSIAGLKHHPNIISELEWCDLNSAEISGAIALSLDSLFFCGKADYGRIFSGRQRDSDYFGDNRTNEVSRSRAKSDKGEVFDLSIGLGYPLIYSFFTFIPLVGWSLDEQHLRQRKGIQSIDTQYPIFEGRTIRGLHSNYRAKWKGPWLGLELKSEIFCRCILSGSLEYHWINYEGTGHWNLRPDFCRDFEHRSDGQGFIGTLCAEQILTEKLTLGSSAVYRKFKTGRGHDRKFFKGRTRNDEEELPISIEFPLNSVHWSSYSLKFYISYSF